MEVTGLSSFSSRIRKYKPVFTVGECFSSADIAKAKVWLWVVSIAGTSSYSFYTFIHLDLSIANVGIKKSNVLFSPFDQRGQSLIDCVSTSIF